QHYKDYNYGTGTHLHGRNIVFPTEFLHGLYDGGHGAGLEDYWKQMQYNPISAGGFLWCFSDEGVVRNDLEGMIDTDGNHAPDGIVGPFREKEGSFYTVRELWSPVFFEKKFITNQFDGSFIVENRYHFTNLNQCSFEYEFATMPKPGEQLKAIVAQGKMILPDIPADSKGRLRIELPDNWGAADILYIRAFDPHGREIYQWSWQVKTPAQVTDELIKHQYTFKHKDFGFYETQDEVILYAGTILARFGKETGILFEVKSDNMVIPIKNGPVLCEGEPNIKGNKVTETDSAIILEIFHEMPVKHHRWIMYPNGLLKLEYSYWPGNYTDFMGVSFDFPERMIKGLRWFGSGPYRVWKNRMAGNMINVWNNDYNNTITGEGKLIYPEFKGYFKDLYWAEIDALPKSFRVFCSNEDVFLRMLTPDKPKNARNDYTSPPFPTGDISFMHGITPIGTKFRNPEKMGPMGDKHLFMNYWRRFSKDLDLYFDFQ
ncbi:MAG: glycoside hydrolase family 2, partial [Bacteroidales bacterium]|nr:glycoside hydrolase family 2 [Bacteroidales bacterium]